MKPYVLLVEISGDIREQTEKGEVNGMPCHFTNRRFTIEGSSKEECLVLLHEVFDFIKELKEPE